MSSEMIRMEFTREEILAMRGEAMDSLSMCETKRDQLIDDAAFYQHRITGLSAWLDAAGRALAQEEASE
jgi:hypothetical protein